MALRQSASLISRINYDSLALVNNYCFEKRNAFRAINHCSPCASNVGHFHSVRNYARPRLSPVEITEIITKNELSSEINQRSIKSFDTNQLASNSPIEDSRAEARCLLTTGLLFGVFDGHGGSTCSQIVAKRLFSYIAASLLPPDVLHKFLDSNLTESSEGIPLLDRYNDELSLRQDLQLLYGQSFNEFVQTLASQDKQDTFEMSKALQRAFTRLDEDIANEAKREFGVDQRLILSIALSGAVACVAHVDGEHMHVASCGDCRAVLGVRTDQDGSGMWKAKVLTNEHNAANDSEVSRIMGEHPAHEHDNIILNDRLMGQLAPLRAFGDYRFKWDKDTINQVVTPFLREHHPLPQSLTPPYLTSTPEVTYHKLRPKDAFLIIGTDGLWDMLSPGQAVRLVGEHMSGKTVLSSYSLPKNKDVTLGTIHETLMKRMESFKLKPIDQNAATHLIRHALGGTPEGLDNNRLSAFLTLSEPKARTYRDDITATVIFFDSDYLSQRPF